MQTIQVEVIKPGKLYRETSGEKRTFGFCGCRIDLNKCQCHSDGKFPCEQTGSIHKAEITYNGRSVIILD